MDNEITNTGVIIDVRPTDFIAGGETGVKDKVLKADGQYDDLLPQDELQADGLLDSFACVTFSATNNVETILNVLYPTLPKSHKDFLKDYMKDGKVNFSDRFTAKMSGTSRRGNSFSAVGDSIRKDGLLPEKDWKWPTNLSVSDSVDERWEKYYEEIPQELKDKAKKFLDYFKISYQWVLVGVANNEKIKERLKYGPVQICSKLCSPWSSDLTMPPIKACGCGTEHATTIYGYTDNALKDYDHYKSFRKFLANDYCIQYAVQYSVEVLKPITEKFTVNLIYGAEGKEVVKLQEALQSLGYMKRGLFGPYGPQTKVALAKFQKDNGIVDDGTHFGPATRKVLNKLISQSIGNKTMNPIIKEHLVSALQTFITVFIGTAGAMLQAGGTIEFSWAFWASIVLAGLRAGVKEVFARFAPVAIGGRK